MPSAQREQQAITIPIPDRIPYLQIFWTFFRVGLLTLGGGLAMSTVVRHELVLQRRWIKDEDFIAELSTATLVPGAIAVNMAYVQGRRLRGPSGAATAVFGTILPSFSIILLIGLFAMPYFALPRVAAFLRGAAVAVAAQLAFACYVFGRSQLRHWRNIVVTVVGLVVVGLLKMHPVIAVLTAAALGYFLCIDSESPSTPSHKD